MSRYKKQEIVMEVNKYFPDWDIDLSNYQNIYTILKFTCNKNHKGEECLHNLKRYIDPCKECGKDRINKRWEEKINNNGLTVIEFLENNHVKYSCNKCNYIDVNNRRNLAKTKKYICKYCILLNQSEVIKNGSSKLISITGSNVLLECENGHTYTQDRQNLLANKKCKKCYLSNKSADFTLERIIEKFKEIHGEKFIYDLSSFQNTTSFIKITCENGHTFQQKVSNHLDGKGCLECYHNSTNRSFSDLMVKFKRIHGDNYIYDVDSFTNISGYMLMTCKKGHTYNKKINQHLKGMGCKICRRMTLEEVKIKFHEVHGNNYKYFFDTFTGASKLMDIECSYGHKFKQKPTNHIMGKGCKICNRSHGERKISMYLDKIGVNYITEYSFNDCVYKQKLKFDFFIPDINMLIEFDGIQHFEVDNFFGGIKSFEKTKIRDNIKNVYCEENGINLVRIPYFDDLYQRLDDLFKK